MKKHITLLGLIVGIFFFYSCEDQLELLPPQSVDQTIALSSDANIKRVLIGAYAKLRTVELYGGWIQLYGEMLGSNNEIRWEGTYNQPREVYNKAIFTNNSFITDTWISAYNAINIANNILSVIDVVDEEDRDRVRGEALFIRGALYFELVKFYGLPYSAGSTTENLGVPLVLTPTTTISEEDFVVRNTVAEVYQQILADLTLAESLLPPTNGVFAKNHVASAMLSRVYLQMERFGDARDAANRAIISATEAGKSLVTSGFMNAFNNDADTSEDLFSIQVNTQDGTNDMHLFYSTPDEGARGGDITILQNHIALYEAEDQRLTQFSIRAEDLRTDKWRQQFKNVKVVRLAEMYLTRAEANFREGTSTGATPLEDINRIRARVDLPAKTTLSLQEILLERKLELAHEGHIIHDVKRTRGTIRDNINAEIIYSHDDPRMVFPIPQREMDVNENLIQNPGYAG
ncbi:RagB/SusD family nutrient uptake outer membrane protein [Lunatibacter salilacus]|uniref:RagB/SusD family nutrient uptake outer membrane protein n=1 Tax=Lunatibacter salilacus TaxID=2483804 RepID=UPI00131E3211|nr:RagB/SusD family nutrient uptake outer membrane protein [Lunatibacter salilacus]